MDFHSSEIRVLVLLPLTILLIYKIIKMSLKVRSPQEQRWQFLFEIYKSDRLDQRLFVLFYVMRVSFVSLVIGSLSRYPRIQGVLMVLVNFGMLIYLIWGSPIQRTLSKIQHLVIEIPLLLYNIFFIFLAVTESNINVKNALGQLMTILYFITSIITPLIILIKFLHIIYCILFKTHDGFERVQSQNIDEGEEVVSDNSEQQQNEVDLMEINQEGKENFYTKNNLNILDSNFEADVVIE